MSLYITTVNQVKYLNKVSLELKHLFQVKERLINKNVSHKKKVPLNTSEILVSNISCVNLSLSEAEIVCFRYNLL